MAESNGEKIIRLETQMQNATHEIGEVKGLVKELIVKVDSIATIQNEIGNLRIETTTLKAEITNLKSVNNAKNTILWVGLVASAIINIIALYNIFAE